MPDGPREVFFTMLVINLVIRFSQTQSPHLCAEEKQARCRTLLFAKSLGRILFSPLGLTTKLTPLSLQVRGVTEGGERGSRRRRRRR